MSRSEFGGTSNDFLFKSSPFMRVTSGTLTFWSAASGGTQYTDLLLSGSPVPSITVGSDGMIPLFSGPDGITSMWADEGAVGGARSLMVTTDGAALHADRVAAEAVGTTNDTVIASRINDTTPSASHAALAAQTLLATTLIGKAMTKLRTGAGLTINVRGDSTVYGQDTVSADKVAAPGTVLPDGSTHTLTRSPSPWPSVLETRLNAVYTGGVTVINQGYSGDWVDRGYDRWTANPNADVTLYAYGINDAATPAVPDAIRGNVPAYVTALEKMVKRDLAWGSAVVFTTPTRQRGQAGTGVGPVTDAYRSALHNVADKYGIPVIDAEQFMTNAKRDAWSDDFHFNTKGYGIIGSRMASLFIGGALLRGKLREVVGGSKTVPRLHDGWVFPAGVVGSLSGGYYTPNDDLTGQGNGARVQTATGTDMPIGYVSFYAAEPDLVIFPYYFLTGVTGETGVSIGIELDFGVEQGDNYHDHVIYAPGGAAQDGPPATVPGTPIVGVGTFYNRDALTQSHAMRVSTPGWHTLTVKATRSSASSIADLLAIEFFSWRDWQDMNRLGRGALQSLSSPTFDESAAITQTVVSWPDLMQRLGVKPWSHQYASPILRLAVKTYGIGVVEYSIVCNRSPDNAGSDIAASAVDANTGETASTIHVRKLNEFNFTNGGVVPSTNGGGRELASVQYRASDQSLLLNWRTTNSSDGTTAKNMNKAFDYQVRLL